MKRRPVLAMALLAVVFAPNWALAQVSGSGGVAQNEAAAAALIDYQATPQFTVFSGRVDHAAAGTGLRNFDSGTIRLRGIPTGSTVVRAYLYWAMLCVSTTNCPTSVDVEFEGRTISSTRICTGVNPCWAGGPIAAYRADVTGLMPATTPTAVANKVINGDYRLNGFPSHPAERDGRDPWSPITTNLPKLEGATLLVVYSNPSLSTMGRVYIHNGCSTFSGTLNVSNALVPAAYMPSFVKFTRFGADGQAGSGTVVSPSVSNETTFFGGPSTNCATATLTQIAGDGSLYDRDSDWNGHDGEPLNQLWDTRTTVVTGRLGQPSAANYCVRYVSAGDCITSIGYVLSVR
jgi:hypothetical protein